MATKRDATRAAWAEHLRQWRQSGKPRLEYCREHGIRDHQMRYWSGRLASGSTAPRAFAKAVGPTPSATSIGNAARLVLPSGAVIEFAAAVDPAWIGRVAQEVAR